MMYQIIKTEKGICYHSTGVYHTDGHDAGHECLCRLAEEVYEAVQHQRKEFLPFLGDTIGCQFAFMDGIIGYDCENDLNCDMMKIIGKDASGT